MELLDMIHYQLGSGCELVRADDSVANLIELSFPLFSIGDSLRAKTDARTQNPEIAHFLHIEQFLHKSFITNFS